MTYLNLNQSVRACVRARAHTQINDELKTNTELVCKVYTCIPVNRTELTHICDRILPGLFKSGSGISCVRRSETQNKPIESNELLLCTLPLRLQWWKWRERKKSISASGMLWVSVSVIGACSKSNKFTVHTLKVHSNLFGMMIVNKYQARVHSTLFVSAHATNRFCDCVLFGVRECA